MKSLWGENSYKLNLAYRCDCFTYSVFKKVNWLLCKMQAVICTNWGSAGKSKYLGICANNWTRQYLAGSCFQESSTLQLTMTPAPLCRILCCFTRFHFLLGPGMGHSNPRQRIKSEQKLMSAWVMRGHHPNAYQLDDQGDTWGCIFACMSWQELGNFCWQELNNIALSKTINSCMLLSTFQFCVYFLSSSPLRSSYKITTGPISGLPSAGAHRKWSVCVFWVNDEVFREDQVHCS